MKKSIQNHQSYDQRGRLLQSLRDQRSEAVKLHMNDAALLRTTLAHTYGVHMLGSLVKINKINTNPIAVMAIETYIQPKVKVPNLRTKRNDFWYKGKKYRLGEEQYVLAESIFQSIFPNGETPWN